MLIKEERVKGELSTEVSPFSGKTHFYFYFGKLHDYSIVWVFGLCFLQCLFPCVLMIMISNVDSWTLWLLFGRS